MIANIRDALGWKKSAPYGQLPQTVTLMPLISLMFVWEVTFCPSTVTDFVTS
jgi:hypothetical protein